MLVLVDSSSWVHQLRKSGDPAKQERVNALLEAGEAAWCAPVRLELWRGVTNDAERKTLRRYEALLPDYPITADTWTRAIRLADLLIFACATLNGLALAHDDEHFDALAAIGM